MKKMKYLAGILLLALLLAPAGCGMQPAEKSEGAATQESAAAPAQAETTEAETIQPAPEEPQTADPKKQPAHLKRLLEEGGYRLEDLTGDRLIIVETKDGVFQLSCMEKNEEGIWNENKELSGMPAYAGFNGVGEKQAEGDGITPTGLYPLGFAFGKNEDPGTELKYRPVTENSYWVDDPESESYNQWVEVQDERSFSSAEHLIEFDAYNYAVVIEYNYVNPVRGKGSAIFLHCGTGNTRGCVAIAEESMIKVLKWLRPGAQICITE